MASARHHGRRRADPRLSWPERELIRRLGIKVYDERLEGGECALGSSRTRCSAAASSKEVREKDPDGRIVYHHRTVDTLGKMLRTCTIDQAMHDAAKDFQASFIVAQLDRLRAVPILRVPGTGREPELNERQLHAPSGARGHAGAGWHLEPGGLVRVARRRAAEERSGVGDATGVGRTSGPAGAGTGDSSGGARDASGALRVQ
jgi:hypothetical protein